MFCPNCGNELNSNAKFCSKCGSEISSPPTKNEAKPLTAQINGKKLKSISFIAIGIIVLVIVLALIFGNKGTSLKSFQIEGTWKNVGTETCAQMQQGSITTFNGTNCNVYSPNDTYAFYKDGDNYRLECTSFFAGDTMSFTVVVLDNDEIELYYGGDMSSDPVVLNRIEN